MMRAFPKHLAFIPGIATLLIAFSSAQAADAFQEPQDITFTAAIDGSAQNYVLLLPEGFEADTKHSLMIALHGHGSDRWQFINSAYLECKAARDVALKHNLIFVSPDYRAKTSWMGPKAEADVVQIIADLKKTYSIDKVILVGASMGGSSSLTFTALHSDLIHGVVSLNGTANHLNYEKFQDAIQASFGGTQQAIPEEYKRRSAEYWPEKFTMPTAFTTGGKDTVVPHDSVSRLAHIIAKLNKNTLHIHRPETGHTTSYEDSVAAYDYVCTLVLAPETSEP